MGSKYTEAQKKATAKFMEDKHTIRVVVTKEKANEYKAMAEAEGKSFSQFIIDCIEGQLYQTAVESRNRYKEQGEELTDFDEFMDDMEKEYSAKGQG